MIVLSRFISTDFGVVGRLTIGIGPWKMRMFTLERPWKNNERNVSCIPSGVYDLEKRYSEIYQKDMFFLKDVEGRDGIMIHSGNTIDDTGGCILIGLDYTIDNGMIMIHESTKALKTLFDVAAMEKINLERAMTVLDLEGFEFDIINKSQEDER
jgi:hypothetical protein